MFERIYQWPRVNPSTSRMDSPHAKKRRPQEYRSLIRDFPFGSQPILPGLHASKPGTDFDKFSTVFLIVDHVRLIGAQSIFDQEQCKLVIFTQ
jgi:hypothetical protein